MLGSFIVSKQYFVNKKQKLLAQKNKFCETESLKLKRQCFFFWLVTPGNKKCGLKLIQIDTKSPTLSLSNKSSFSNNIIRLLRLIILRPFVWIFCLFARNQNCLIFFCFFYFFFWNVREICDRVMGKGN